MMGRGFLQSLTGRVSPLAQIIPIRHDLSKNHHDEERHWKPPYAQTERLNTCRH